MVRAPCCEEGVKKGPWGEEEDKALIDFIQRHGHGNWRSLPKRAGLLRCGKSCRLRWINYLRPDIKRGKFTPEEEETITSMHAKLGNKWSSIAANLPGRTDNEIKNVWHTYLKKRTHPEEATQAAVPVPKKSSKFKREAKNKLDHSASSANESGGDATRLLHTQVSVESTCNGFSSPDITTDSISAVSSSANYSNSTGAPNYCEELKEIDESFWLEALSMDITPAQVMDTEIDESFWLEALSMDITPAQVMDTAAPAAVGDAFSLFANSESMEFWLKVFMENMPKMDPEDKILAT